MWMFIAGCAVGTFVGFFMAAMCVASKQADQDAGLD